MINTCILNNYRKDFILYNDYLYNYTANSKEIKKTHQACDKILFYALHISS